jgi:hypothetical protein
VRSGLEIFEKDLHSEVVAEIREWSKHPELSKLLEKLYLMKDWEQFLDIYSEAMVARHLISQGCDIKVEVPTKNGKSADFKVSKDSHTFFVHVKRLNFDKEFQHDLNVGTRLDSLRKKGFGFSPNESLTDDEMQQFCKEANRFSENANAGESKVITSKTGKALGECYKMPHGSSMTVYSGNDGGDDGRYLKKFKSAYQQFMPDGINIILVTSAWREDSSIEDLRDDMEDFWSNGRHSDSNIIGWFLSHPREKSIDFKLFFRENSEKPPYIVDLFGRNCEEMQTKY